uniref:Organic solute carrier partner 1a n=1 Tax=Oryzias sinensis TaxID=183150 RepID=A0A8C7ZTC6_9TELE
MSTRTLPLVFINLGGEMLYILDQRLQAQNTSVDNTEKGRSSITLSFQLRNRSIFSLLNPKYLPFFFHGESSLVCRSVVGKGQKKSYERHHRDHVQQSLHGRTSQTPAAVLTQDHEDRSHTVSAHLHHEAESGQHGKDLLLITYNHMDAIREFVRDTPAVANQVDETHRKLIEVYAPLSEGEFQLLRQTLLIFFQDMHVRVSLFLKNQIQNPNGRFSLTTSGPVPHGGEVPGLIRLFSVKGREVSRCEFPSGGSYSSAVREGSFDLHGDRVLRLGVNMYTMNHPEETHTSRDTCAQPDDVPNLLAKEELNLLAGIMGSMKTVPVHSTEGSFRLNLFASDREEEEAGTSGGAQDFDVINIQAMQDEQASAELARIAAQFAEEELKQEDQGSSKGDELLAMMDDL